MGAAGGARAALLRRVRRAGRGAGARRASERGRGRGDARRARRDRVLGRHRHRPRALRRRAAPGDRSGAGASRCRRARLLEAALERDLPTLAICRGFQLLNVFAAATSSSISRRRSVTRVIARRSVCSRSTRSTSGRAPGSRPSSGAARGGALESSSGRRPGRCGTRRERVRGGRIARGVRGSVEAVRTRACSGIPRWRRTTSGSSRRSSIEARLYRSRR